MDALYYSTVTLTTTGYWDIAPVIASAREAENALLLEQSGAASVIVSSEGDRVIFAST